MIEIAVLVLGLFCPTPDLPAEQEVVSVLETGWSSPTVYGSSPYDLPTESSDDGMLTYRVTVDPMYLSYGPCFYQQVRQILDDPRSWDGIREARPDETPQIWIILSAPGDCGLAELPIRSCARRPDVGKGRIGINVLRWFNGSGNTDLATERIHIVNHEMGHLLGYDHARCGDVMAPYYELSATCELTPWPPSISYSQSHQ